jgi:hypothetical protein
MGTLDCSVRTYWAGASWAGGTHSVISLEERVKRSEASWEGVGAWRCIKVDNLSAAELQSGTWHTEPRSNRQTCVEEVEFDADAQRGEDPQ